MTMALWKSMQRSLFAMLLLSAVCVAQKATAPATVLLDTYNYIVGTQNIGTAYQFTDKSLLIEGGERIQEMGSNMMKIAIGPKYVHSHYAKQEDPNIHSITELAQSMDYKAVFNMPFSRYFLWTDCFSTYKKITPWHGHMNPAILAAEYKEVYDFTHYLLTTYNGTGKIFYLGNWEGDWLLLSGAPAKEKHGDEDVNPDAPQGMIDWGVTRQRAVDDARRDTPHKNVEVWYYIEANHVLKSIHDGKISVASSVLQAVNPDYVSFSSYDATNKNKDLNRDLPDALNYMQSKLKPKPGLPEKRVFIGEFGAPARSYSPDAQAQRIREVSAAAIKWGTPFVLYWQLYTSKVKEDDSQLAGFWLIDNHGIKQPAFYLYQHYFADAKAYVADFEKKNKRKPNEQEFQSFAYKWFTASGKP
jgi:hypothetical protein